MSKLKLICLSEYLFLLYVSDYYEKPTANIAISTPTQIAMCSQHSGLF